MSEQERQTTEDLPMSDSTRPVTEGELEPLLQAFVQFFEGSGPAFQALFHQARANTLVCALLVREMTKAELVDAEALRQEAIATAERFELPGSAAEVIKVITGIFGGEPAEIPPQVILRVIQGGLKSTSHSRHENSERNAGEPPL